MVEDRSSLALAIVACALALPGLAAAQFRVSDTTALATAPSTSLLARTSLGLTLGPSTVATPACSDTSLVCRSERPMQLHATTMLGKSWGVQVGYVETGRIPRLDRESRAQGLNMSLVGQTSIGNSFGLFGRLGTTYARSETTVMGGSANPSADQGFGLSVAAGVSYAFTPRLSATFELDSSDYRFGGSRDPVRGANLGLQYRY